MDSNNDGIGDINGIISKLDYLKDLGIETIWFSPLYKSPQRDFGYDISDYLDIAPEYGTLEICETLIREIHKRDMKVVMDMVMNHTSNEHPWFIESKSSKDNPKRNWYVWRDGKKPNGKKPPTNWHSLTGGSSWHYDRNTDQWYLAQFLPFQPDLNYRNPETKKAMFDVVRFWLRKGVDGFRLDMINAIYEDDQFRDNPFMFSIYPTDEKAGVLFQHYKFTQDLPETMQFAKELRQVINEFSDPERVLIGEVSGNPAMLKKYCGEHLDGLQLVFLFQSIRTPLKAKKFTNLIRNFEFNFPDPFMPTWVFGNHDGTRRITRLGNDPLKMKLNAAFQLTTRGVPFIYYGEEIGMEDLKMNHKTGLDAIAIKYRKVPTFLWNIIRSITHEALNRDECRTPMQWDDSENAGFSAPGVKTWLPISKSFKERNVKVEFQDEDSILNCYRRFLKIRQSHPALTHGACEILDSSAISNDILAYMRVFKTKDNDEKIVVYLNFSDNSVEFILPFENTEFLCSTHAKTQPLSQTKLKLLSYEGVCLKIK